MIKRRACVCACRRLAGAKEAREDGGACGDVRHDCFDRLGGPALRHTEAWCPPACDLKRGAGYDPAAGG